MVCLHPEDLAENCRARKLAVTEVTVSVFLFKQHNSCCVKVN